MKSASVLVVVVCLSVAGCSSVPRAPVSYDLSHRDLAEADALAHFATGLLMEGEQGWFSDAALQEFIRAADLDPKEYHLYSRVALSYLYKGDTAKAIAILETACRNVPENAQARIDLATLYHVTGHMDGHVDKAIESYRAASRLAPERGSLYLETAKLLFWKKRDAEAIACLRKAFQNAASAPGSLLTYCHEQGRRFLALGEPARALPCLRLVADNLPADKLTPAFYLLHGSALERSGDIKESQRVFEKCLQVHPDTHEVLNYLAYMWAERAIHLPQALEYVNRALAMEPENGAYIDTLGWIYHRQGRHMEALEQIRKASTLIPDDPTITDHLGDCLKATGDEAQALEQWKQSLRLDPGNETVARKLSERGVDVAELRTQAEIRRKAKQKEEEKDIQVDEEGDEPDAPVIQESPSPESPTPLLLGP